MLTTVSDLHGVAQVDDRRPVGRLERGELLRRQKAATPPPPARAGAYRPITRSTSTLATASVLRRGFLWISITAFSESPPTSPNGESD